MPWHGAAAPHTRAPRACVPWPDAALASAVLDLFVSRSADKPDNIVKAGPEACIHGLADGTYDAVITDQSTLAWYSKHIGVPGVYVSPVLQQNPFAFVYSTNSLALRRYVDPAVTAAVLTNPDWAAETAKLQLKWFSVQNNLGDLGDNPVEWKTLIAAIVLFTLPLIMSLFNGDVGPGVFMHAPPDGWRGRVRKMLEKPTEAEDKAFMDDREGAMQGHDLSFFRFAVHRLDMLTRGLPGADQPPGALLQVTHDGYAALPPSASSSDLGLSAGSSPGGSNSVLLAALKIEMAAMLAPLAEDVRSLKAQLSKGR